jgi:hypothetical protein
VIIRIFYAILLIGFLIGVVRCGNSISSGLIEAAKESDDLRKARQK